MKKFYKFVCWIFLFILTIPQSIWAEEITYTPKDISIMFVVDASYSMNKNDPNKIAENMMELLIDGLPSKRIHIGYVAYNDAVTTFLEPMPIETYEQRNAIKNSVENIRKVGYSDMGLGMKKGYELVTKNLQENIQPIMVLISDGETSLPKNSNRTIKHSNLDINDVINQGKQMNMPIYTISFGKSTNTLKQISYKTDAKTYENPTADNLIEIFNEITNKYLISTLKPIIETVGTGERQEIMIPIEDLPTTESNILFISSSPINEPKVEYSGDNIFLAKAKYYVSTKVFDPQKKELKFQFRGRKNSSIKGYLLSDYDISLILDVPDTIYKNKLFKINAYFRNNENNKAIKDCELYKQITPTITLLNKENKICLPINILKDKIQSHTTICNSGNYVLNTAFAHESFNIKFNKLSFNVENNPPKSEFPHKIKIPVMSENKVYQLDKFFHDPDSDALTYEFIDFNIDKSNLDIMNSQLIIKPHRETELKFRIKASDNEGLTFTTQPIILSIVPKLQYYYPIVVTILCVLIGCIIFFIYYRKKKASKYTFTGKINGYFIRLKDEEEIPPLIFPLYQFENKKRVSLEELLRHAKVEKPYLNANQIYFEPGLDRSIVFYNKSSATMMMNASIMRKNVKYTLEYKTKIYITFEDGVSEMELHYNKFNPTIEKEKVY
ncbi:MAG: VWA domain-containing protein [Marinisporobacter sp.]|jgi:hypothetical protein|nr:VWA domain-containing protein [Marinisporobacter sp.]